MNDIEPQRVILKQLVKQVEKYLLRNGVKN